MASGFSPAILHLISKNFSAPKSAPKPASVTTISASLSAVFVATTLLHPWAILAKGPPWMMQGVFSKVWTKLGFMASFKRAVKAPSALISEAKTGFLSKVYPIKILEIRLFRSSKSSARQRIAIISEAVVIENPSFLSGPFFAPWPIVIFLRVRSLTSKARFQVTFSGSIPSSFPW